MTAHEDELSSTQMKQTPCAGCGRWLHLEVAVFCCTCGRKLTDPAAAETRADEGGEELLPGKIILARFELVRELGRGGMATVYEARDLAVGSSVALKFLHEHLADNDTVVRRFLREAEVARELQHPGIVRSLGSDNWNGRQFIAMELVDGQTLTALMRSRGALGFREGLHLLDMVLDALQYAHGAGVIHRDVKPQNIMVTRNGRVKIVDFGLAAIRDSAATTLTRTGAVLGTTQYMSPEQLHGGSIDFRADIYAAGVLIFEMFTGQLPFNGRSMMEVAYKHIYEEPPRPRGLRHDMSKRLETVILRCLAKRPAERYASVETLRLELHDAIAGKRMEERRHDEIGDLVTEDGTDSPWDLILYSTLAKPDWDGKVVRYDDEFYRVMQNEQHARDTYRYALYLKQLPRTEIVNYYIDYERYVAEQHSRKSHDSGLLAGITRLFRR
ncbi:MAG: serine/threonine protein kinase [Candidatus Schekmanbacteria bacterium]|nr:serine/threonine protein kinase [Candidatus Schekmanbacteria bacterium]